MCNRTAAERAEARYRGRHPEPEDVLRRVLQTHMAPVTGLEQEVALLVFGRPPWTIASRLERERV